MFRNKSTMSLLTVAGLSLLLISVSFSSVAAMKTVTQQLVAPPNLPEHSQVAEGEPKLVKVTLVVA